MRRVYANNAQRSAPLPMNKIIVVVKIFASMCARRCAINSLSRRIMSWPMVRKPSIRRLPSPPLTICSARSCCPLRARTMVVANSFIFAKTSGLLRLRSRRVSGSTISFCSASSFDEILVTAAL